MLFRGPTNEATMASAVALAGGLVYCTDLTARIVDITWSEGKPFKQTYRQVGPTPEQLEKLSELGYEPIDAGAKTYRA